MFDSSPPPHTRPTSARPTTLSPSCLSAAAASCVLGLDGLPDWRTSPVFPLFRLIKRPVNCAREDPAAGPRTCRGWYSCSQSYACSSGACLNSSSAAKTCTHPFVRICRCTSARPFATPAGDALADAAGLALAAAESTSSAPTSAAIATAEPADDDEAVTSSLSSTTPPYAACRPPHCRAVARAAATSLNSLDCWRCRFAR